jgi:hypothetical protein
MLKVRTGCQLLTVLSVLTAHSVSAQTVYVTNAPPGNTVEFMLDSTVVGSAEADASGVARVEAPPDALGSPQITALLRVDNCGSTSRIVVFNSAREAPPVGTCTRTEIAGLFVVQPITSLVFGLRPGTPSVRLRQGPAPSEWLTSAEGDAAPKPPARPFELPARFVVFGGGGMAGGGEFTAVQCGNVSCDSDDTPYLWTGGLDYWFGSYIGVEGSFIKPSNLSASVSASDLSFNTESESGVFTASALGGVPVGPVRIVGKLGATYHRATVTTVETVSTETATVDDVEQVVVGGTQTIQVQTSGWGWVWSGGLEVWLTGPLGFYGEVGMLNLQGKDRQGGPTKIDDTRLFFFAGAKLRIPFN